MVTRATTRAGRGLGLGATFLSSVALGADVPLTIDGSSVEAFNRSHAALVASLPAPDRVRLRLLETSLVACQRPVTPSGGPAGMPELPHVSSIRDKLSGLTYPQIAQLSSRAGCKVRVGFVTESPSNNRVERPRER